MTQSHSVLLIVGGGIAAYKTPELVRQLAKRGIGCRVIVTEAGSHFVAPLALASVTGHEVHTKLLDLTAEARMGHIELSRSADLIVVAPATADLMAKAASGFANDLASTALLATDKPVMMAPAMNVRMWDHPATRRNLATLMADGVTFIGPDEGEMACGEFGPGRMAEPDVIADAIATRLTGSRALAGRHVLITAGPTVEPLDPVRFLSNRSSGKQGYALAAALASLGARVTLVSGPTGLACPPGVERTNVETARQMLAACQAALPADVFVAVAAVADWRPAETHTRKLKLKGAASMPPLKLAENPDILATLSAPGMHRPGLVVGFAAETNDVEAHAQAKLAAKGCDWIVANDVSGDVMGGDSNAILLVTASGTETLPRQAKTVIAGELAARIAAHLTARHPQT
ncbi:MAG: bifunctional phosphopantothenoylcysteine decarboxylase/phosphopantothenate--cysteine ligase CoaBC [Hyphomonadaceae bacterium]|nr:bifunctional phosphopantothenoylcysteine decarboxylase/phosphopantothenate--cysteine ligase CoaBC [Hyphomonadaceae bacterium]